MSETAINFITTAAVYGAMGLGFVFLTNHTFKWYHRQMLKKFVECIEPIFDLAKENTRQIHGIKLVQEEIIKEMSDFRYDCENVHTDMVEQFKALEEMIVMVHQDILYFDEELGQLDARIFRLEHATGKAEPTTIEAQTLSPRVEMPIRRMRELRRRRR